MRTNQRAFSITELVVSIGVSSLIALGVGGTIAQSFKVSQEVQSQADSESIRREIRNELLGASLRKLQNLGTLGDGTQADASEIANCGGRLSLVDEDWSRAIDDLQTSTGTQLVIYLSSSDRYVSAEEADNISTTSVNKTLSLSLANGAIISRDENRSITVTGEIYLTSGNRSDLRTVLGIIYRRPTFITRIVLKRDLTNNNFSECHLPVEMGNTQEICDSTLGYIFDPLIGRCVWQGNVTQNPITLCEPGQSGNSDGTSNANCINNNSGCRHPQDMAVKYEYGELNCQRMAGYPDKPTTTNPFPALPVTAVSPACEGLRQAYEDCLVANTDGDTSVCGSAPPQVGCETVVSTPLTLGPTNTPIAPPPNPSALTCYCGSEMINSGAFCGSAQVGVDLGRGQNVHSERAKIWKCVDGGLVLQASANQVNDGSVDGPDLSGNKKRNITSISSGDPDHVNFGNVGN